MSNSKVAGQQQEASRFADKNPAANMSCRIPLLDGETHMPPGLIESEVDISESARLQSIWYLEEPVFERLLCTSWGLLLRCYTGQDEVCFRYRGRKSETLVERPAKREHAPTLKVYFEEMQTLSSYTENKTEEIGTYMAPELSLESSNTIVQIDGGHISYLPEPHKGEVQLNAGLENGRLRLVLRSQTCDVSAGYLETLALTLGQLLATAVGSPRTCLADLDYLSDRHKRKIWASRSQPMKEEDTCVHDLVYNQVKLRPEHEAVCSWDGAMTYRELWRHSQYLAQNLVGLGIGPEVIVPICFEKSMWSTVAMLAVLQAGAGFCPLDAAQPISRLEGLVSRLGSKIMMCSRKFAQKLSPLADFILPIDAETFESIPNHVPEIKSRASPSNVVYVLWTSGSTGEPKGIVIEHRAYCSSARNHAPRLGIKAGSRMLQYSSYIFDASMVELLTPLMIGATICVPSEHSRLNDLVGAANHLRVDWATLTPSVVNLLTPSTIPGLKILILVGEVMSQEVISTWSSIKLINAYGPAECSVAVAANTDINTNKKPTLIGRAMGVRCWLVDPDNHHRLVPIGCVGELVVEGPTLARGYLNDPERTKASFIKNPAWAISDHGSCANQRMYKTGDLLRQHTSNHMLYFVGRKDNQVKFHGQRIELGEIEHHLSSESAIHHSIVTMPKGGACKQRLVAVVALECTAPAENEDSGAPIQLLDKSGQETARPVVGLIKDRLSKRLPAFMLPSVWLVVVSIPLLKSGKLDRRATSNWIQELSPDECIQLVRGDECKDSPATELESQLRSIWANVLNLRPEQIGLQQSFLSLGGDSISAMMVQSQCKKVNVGITVQDILRAKSISHLATFAQTTSNLTVQEETIEEDFDLSPIQRLFYEFPDRKGHFNQSVFVRLTNMVRPATLHQVIKIIVDRHSMLRARFRLSTFDDEMKQRITRDAAGSYNFRVHACSSKDDAIPIMSRSQESLDPVNGPLFAVDMFNTDDGSQLLFMTGHHLVVDLVSWRVILHDLEELLMDAKSVSHALPSLSFQAWCKLQMEHAHSFPLSRALPSVELPLQSFDYWGIEDSQNLYGNVACEGFELDSFATSLLTSKCHEAMRTDTVDVLIAAMLQSFSRTFVDRAPPTIYNEGHGREVWDRDIDLSRTVGWFTTMYPIHIPSSASEDFIDILRRVKDYRRAIPANGRPYFASRLLTSKGAKRFGRHWPLEITFNYLGIYQQLERRDALLMPVEEMAGEARAAGGKADVGHATPRFGLFEISAVIAQGKLRFSFTFNKNMKHQKPIRSWISACQDTLSSMLPKLTGMTYQPTLSDFPLLSLTYTNLEILMTDRLKRTGISDIGNVEDIYRCSQIQQGLLISRQRDAAFYAIEGVYEVKSNDCVRVDSDRVANAWQRVVQRHASLRTIFVESLSQDDALYDQIVLRASKANIVRVQCATEVEAKDMLGSQSRMDMDDHAPAHRLTICDTSRGKVFCRLEISHTITDGESMSTIFRELISIYEGRSLAETGPLYSNYIAFLQRQNSQAGLGFWKSYLTGVEPCSFPVLNDATCVERELRSKRVQVNDLAELQAFCNLHGVTLANVFHTAWALTLRYYTGSKEVCYGYLMSTRDPAIENVEDIVGYLVNMLVCRVVLEPDTPLVALMQLIQTDLSNGQSHRQTALSEVLHTLDLSGASLFNTSLSYRKLPVAIAQEPKAISFEECWPYHDPTEYSVSINIEASDESASIDLDYWTDSISDGSAANILNTFLHSLNCIVDHAEENIGQLNSISETDRQHILDWNKNMPATITKTVHQVVGEQCAIQPQAAAVEGWDANFTYAELNSLATKLAGYLKICDVGVESFVCLCFEKSAYTVVGMLGVLQAGAAFVSLDPMHPKAALELRIKDTKTRVVLTSPCYAATFTGMGLHVVSISQDFLNELPPLANTRLEVAQPHNPCYVIYTSGSTGTPKGVVMEHQAMVTSGNAHGTAMDFGTKTRVLQFSSYTFDNNIEEIFTTLMRGGVVCVPSDYERMNDLAGAVSRLNANFIDLTPTVATYLNPSEMPTIKDMSLGGEALTKTVLEVWADVVQIHAQYGPSECCINSTHRIGLNSKSDPTSLGRSVGSVSWIVDSADHNRLLPIGAEGELLIEGPILARGYLNDKEKTSKAFIEDPDWARDYRCEGQQEGTPRRMYKTGDLVRYNSDGTISYIGRKDQQVKLYGQRIELGEIEYHVRSHLKADWHFAVELVSFDHGREKMKALVLFVCPQGDEVVSATIPESGLLPVSTWLQTTFKELEASLAKAIPKHMVPSMYIPIARLPLSSSGKLDKKRLHAITHSMTENQMAMFRLAGSSGREPSSDIEKALAELWESVLHREPGSIGMDAQFFRMGGDSMAAIRLVTAARSKGISLTVADIFRNATLAELCKNASISDTLKGESAQPPPKPFELLPATIPSSRIIDEVSVLCKVDQQEIEDIYPSTSIQEGLMALSSKLPGAYVYQSSYRLPGIDLDRFKAAWETVVAEEAILRSRIVFADSLGFLQVVVKGAFDWVEARNLEQASENDRFKPAYNGGSLCGFSIIRDREDIPVFIWTIHHALYDGCSYELILNKVKAVYEGSGINNSPTSPYSTFIRYVSGMDPTKAETFWQNKLSDIACPQFPLLPRPTYQPSVTSSSSQITSITRRAGTDITIPSLVRAAWALTIAAYSNSEDVLFAETVNGRESPVPGIAHMIGPVFATVPVRVKINRDTKVNEYLKQLQEDFVEAMPHQHTGLPRIKRLDSDTAKVSEIQNSIAMNSDTANVDADFWKTNDTDAGGNDFFTHSLAVSFIISASEVRMTAHYDSGVVPEWQLTRIMHYFQCAMTRLNSPEEASSTLSEVLTLPREDEIAIKGWNSKSLTSVESCIHEVLSGKASRLPKSTPAIDSWDAQFTYRELESAATALAHHLKGCGLDSQAYIPICFEKSAMTIIVMLAVLKIGAAFVAIDGESPKARLKTIVDDVDAKIVLCSPKYKQTCESLGIHRVVIDLSMIKSKPRDLGRLSNSSSSDIAYVVFTSGSTGRPKGTLVSHAAFVSGAIAHGPAMGMDSSSRALQFSSYTFDASIVEIFTTLILGGCICVPDDATRLDNPTKVINDFNINWTLLTPSFAQMISPSDVPGLKTLVLGGEAMSQNHLSTWADNTHLVNAYGPSECAVVATVNSHVTATSSPAEIGQAVGSHGFIVSQHNHDELVPVGAIGELVITGPILANGYLNNTEKTRMAFIESPKWVSRFPFLQNPNKNLVYKTGDLVKYTERGSFLYVGRKDNQIKLHGQRMELGEVEHHIGQVSTIRHGLAVMPSSGLFEKRLVGLISLKERMKSQLSHKDLHVVDRNDAASQTKEVRGYLSNCLAPYMVPSNWVVLQDIPLTPSGKLDRRRMTTWLEQMPEEIFKQLFAIGDSQDAEQGSAVEQSLQAAWSKVLNLPIEKIGLEQNFLYLGGDSISALQVASHCRAEGLGVSVQDIIRCSSISHLATKVTLPETTHYADEEYDRAFDLSPIQHLFFDWVGENVNHFNQSVAVKLNHRKAADEVSIAIEKLAMSHSMLRARFEKSEAHTWVQKLDRNPSQSCRFNHHSGSYTTEEIISIIERTQSGLDIQNGPIFAANLFESHEDSAQVLSLVIHHLAVDVVSWGIILEDLNELLVSGRTMHQPSLSFQIWSRLQSDQIHSQSSKVVHPELSTPVADYAYWGMSNKSNVYGAVNNMDFSIDESTTSKLLGPCNQPLQTELIDVLLGSLLYSFSRAFPDRKSTPAVFNEAHGREPWDSSIDLSRTVGWFTTIAPVFLPTEASQDADIVKVIRWVKDQRSRSKDKGRHYFANRMLSEEGRDTFANHWPMEIAFNYLGQEKQFKKTGSMLQSLDWLSSDSDVGTSVARFALFEISASVSKDRLKVSCSYSKQIGRQNAIKLWVTELDKALRHCSERLLELEPQPTLSSFPLLPLGYDAIEKLEKILPSKGISSLSDLQDVYSCSPMQRGLLLSQIKNTGQYMFQSIFSVGFLDSATPVDCKQLSRAWGLVVQKHSALRTVFIESVANEGLMDQAVVKSTVPRIAISHCGSTDPLKALSDQKTISFTEAQPHHQLTICETNGGQVFCKLELSHAICDGTSIPLLLDDLAYYYSSDAKARTEKLRYRDYISHIQQTSQTEDVAYWRQYLQRIEPCYFPSLLDSTKEDRESRTVHLELENMSQVQSFCSKHSVTLSNVLQLVWSLVLRSYTGSDNVCFGYLNSGREVPLEGIEDAVGLFISMLVCRMDISSDMPISKALEQIQSDYAQSTAHQGFSLSDMQHEVNISGKSLFNTAFSFQKRPELNNAKDQGLVFDVVEGSDSSEYDMTVNVEARKTGIEIEFYYWTDFLCDTQAKNIADTFKQILHSVLHTEDSQQAVGNMEVCSRTQMEQIFKWNQAPLPNVDRCVHEIIYEQSQSRELSTPAICSWDTELTYLKLMSLSKRLSKQLAALGVGPDSYIPICFEKSSWAVVGMLGILQAGGAFVPLDPSHPESRIRFILSNVNAKLVLCSPKHKEKFDGLDTINTVVLDEDFYFQDQATPECEPSRPSPTNAAYLIFTSGTTGLPKGTIISHQAFATGATEHAPAILMNKNSRVLQFSNLCFDASIMEILTTLMTGGCVCIPSDEERLNDISGAIERMSVNWTLLTPSVANVLEPETAPSLQVLVTGGEAMQPRHIAKWRGKTSLVNAYGPSECAVIATTSIKVDESGTLLDENPAVIGSAVGCRSWVVNPTDHTRLMPIGSVGELAVEGYTLARGYLNNEEKTAKAFVTCPSWKDDRRRESIGCTTKLMYKTGDLVRYTPDGKITYVSRKDTQIKLNGLRIELGEIEHHVKKNLPESIQTSVELVATAGQPRTLGVFFCSDEKTLAGETAKPDSTDTVLLPMTEEAIVVFKTLKASLAGALPTYMIPSLFIPISRMPWTSSGKLDRPRLCRLVASLPKAETAPFRLVSSSSKRIPATRMEKKLEGLWRELLNLEPGAVTLDDSFFVLGGDSVQAMKLVATAREQQILLSVLDIFRKPRLFEMAEACSTVEEEDQEILEPFSMLSDVEAFDQLLDEVVAHCRVKTVQVADLYPCSALQEGLVTMSIKQAGAYVAQNVFLLHQSVDLSRLKEAWDKAVEEMDILRTRIVHTSGSRFFQVVLHCDKIEWHTATSTEEITESPLQLPAQSGSPLMRFTIVDNGNGSDRYLVWSIHHSIYDGWSMPKMLQRVEDIYAEDMSPQMKARYSGFIRYLSSINSQAADQFWESKFRGMQALPFPNVSLAEDEEQATTETLEYAFELSSKPVGTGITLPTMIRAAWGVLLSSHTGHEDVIFGETMAGRDIPVDGILDMLGPTITTVPARIQAKSTLTVMEYLQNINEMAAETIPYQHVGLQNIRKLSAETTKACDFHNLLVIQAVDNADNSEIWVPQDIGASSNFFTYPLVLEFHTASSGIHVDAHYNDGIIPKWHVQRLLSQFDLVLSQLCSALPNGEMKLGDVRIVTEQDLKLIREWADRVSFAKGSKVSRSLARNDKSSLKDRSSYGSAWIVNPKSRDRLVPLGCAGELLLEGPSLAREYLGDEDKASAAVVDDPAWTTQVFTDDAAHGRFYKTGHIVKYSENGNISFVGEPSYTKSQEEQLESVETEAQAEDMDDDDDQQTEVDENDLGDSPGVTETLQKLREIWASVFGVPIDQIDLNEPFMSQGGDSLIAMSLVARCRRISITLTLQEVLQSKSLTQIADTVDSRSKQAKADKPVALEEKADQTFELSPIQQLYFQVAGSSSDHTREMRFNQSQQLRIKRKTEAKTLQNAIEAIVQQHSMFRARFFRSKDGAWKQRITRIASESYRFREHHQINSMGQMLPILLESQKCLNLQKGPLLAVELINTEKDGQVLSLVAHHLIIDVVSWNIVLQQLADLLAFRTDSIHKPLSFQVWCKMQSDQASSREESRIRDLLPYDVQPANIDFWGMTGRTNTYSETRRERFSLDESTTKMILGKSNKALRTQPVEMFMAALIHSFSNVFPKRKSPTIFNESHGRDAWDESIDLTGTTGWFTSLFPIHVVAAEKEPMPILDVLKRIKDLRRSVPGNGRDYFAHRYLTSDGRTRFGEHTPMEILFNYTGQSNQIENDDSLFQPYESEATEDEEKLIGDVGPHTRRLALFEISVVVSNDQASYSFIYNSNMQHGDKILQWVTKCQQTLEELAKQLVTLRAEPTLHDYPLLPTDYVGLDIHMKETLPEIGLTCMDDVEDIYVCAPTQEGLLLAQINDPAQYLSHVILDVKLPQEGARINPQLLARAWQKVVDRHQSLRTVFVHSVCDRYAFDQLVVKNADGGVKLFHCDDAHYETELDKISLIGVNKTRRPQMPYQLSICTTTSGKCYAKLELNHAVLDGGSGNIVTRDLGLAYQGLLPEAPRPLFSDYIKYINSHEQGAGVRFWTKNLDGVKRCYLPKMSTIPVARQSLNSTFLDFDRFDELQAFCRKNEVTISNVMLAAWGLVLKQETKCDDICFGNLTAGRDVPVEGIQDAVGAFINMLVCRLDFSQYSTLKDIIRKVQSDFLESLPHQHCSLARIQHELGLSKEPLFNTAISIQNQISSLDSEKEGEVIEFETLGGHAPTEFVLNLNIRSAPGDEAVRVEYWTSHVTDAEAERITKSYADALDSIMDQPDQVITLVGEDATAVKPQKGFKIPPKKKKAQDEQASGQNLPIMSGALTNVENALPFDYRDFVRDTVQEVMREVFQSFDMVPRRPGMQQVTAPPGRDYDQFATVIDHAQRQDDNITLYGDPKDADSGVHSEVETIEEMTKMLRSFWSSVLSVPKHEIRNDDSFFVLGGDSILAMEMVSVAREAGLMMSVEDIFISPVFADMAQSVLMSTQKKRNQDENCSESSSITERDELEEQDQPNHFSLLEASDTEAFIHDYICPKVGAFRGAIVDALPVTDFQAVAVTGTLVESKWMLNYFMFDGNGYLDLERFRKSAIGIVQMFDILRTVFIPCGNRFLQVVLRSLRPQVQVYETEDDFDEYTRQLRDHGSGSCPKLGEPYIQFIVLKRSTSRAHRIIIRLSHAQYDGICLPRIFDAFRAGYEGNEMQPSPPFADYVMEAARSANNGQHDYWKGLLRGSSMTHFVKREQPVYRAADLTTSSVSPEIRRSIKVPSLAAKNITAATILKAAWAVTLAQLSGKSDVVFGNLTSGRNIPMAGVESIVGPCVNIIPVRIKLEPKWTVQELLRRVQNQQIASMSYESMGFRDVVQNCTDWPEWTYFSSVVQHQNIARDLPFQLGRTKYKAGMIGMADTMADILMVSTPKGEDMVEVVLDYVDDGSIPLSFVEKALNLCCDLAQTFASSPTSMLPTSMGIPDAISFTQAPDINHSTETGSILRGLKKSDVFDISDTLNRAWRVVLPSSKQESSIMSMESSFYKMGGDIISLASLTAYLGGEGYEVRLEELIARPTMGEQIVMLSSRKSAMYSSSSTLSSTSDQPAPPRAAQAQTPTSKRVGGKLWDKSVGLARKMRMRRAQAVQ